MRKLVSIFVLLFTINISAQQTTLYFEDFNSYSNGTGTGSGSPAMWTTAGGSSPEWAVRNQEFRGYDDCSNARWTTKDITVTGYSNVYVSMDVHSTIDNQDPDYFRVYYNIDGGTYVLAFEQYQGFTTDKIDFQVPVDGTNNTITIRVRVDIDDWETGNQKYFFDNVLVDDCQGINAGTTEVTEDTVINNSPVELTLSGEDGGTTIQWQISENGTDFSNLDNATVSPYTTYGLLGEKWYYFRAKVDNGSCFSYSDIDSVYVGASFCTTTYDVLVNDTINSDVNYNDGVVQIHPVSQINGDVSIDNDGFNNFGEINGSINFNSNGGYFCNEGTINANDLSDNSNGGNFSNYGFITITNDFTIDNNGGSWHSWCDFTVEGNLNVQGNSEPHFTGTVHINGDLNLQNNGDVYIEDSTVFIIDGDLINNCTGLHLGVNSYISCNNLINHDDIIGEGTNSNEYAQIIINGTTSSNGESYTGYLDVCSFSTNDNPILGPNVTQCENMVVPTPTVSYCTGSYVPPLSAYLTDQTNLLCHGVCDGTATVTPYGGINPITYLWDNNDTDSIATNLCAGTHQVTVTDAVDSTVVVDVTITEPDTLESSYLVVDLNCYNSNDGSITFTAIGGTTPYEYQINPPGTGYQSSNVFNGLSAGSYAVTVQDANHCRNTYVKINVTEPDDITLSTTLTHINCNGDNDGNILVHAIGGTPAYQYNFGSGLQADSNYANLGAGTYSVTVQDSHGCTASLGSIEITEPANPLTLTPSSNNSTCGNSNGSATVTPAGGTSPYTYSWADDASETSNTLSNLSAGGYVVTVEDHNGCTETITVNVSDASTGTLSFINDVHNECYGYSNGSVEASMTGGTSPFTYTWDNGGSTATISNLAAGTYSVDVEDANHCVVTGSFTINQQPEIQISLTDYALNCYNDNTGSISADVTGGTPTNGTDYTYNWSNGTNGVNADSISGLSAGTLYTLTITDDNSCTKTDTITLSQPSDISLSSTLSYIDCYGNTNGAIQIHAIGGTPSYTYSIDGTTFQTDSNLTGLGAGTYSVTVHDSHNCPKVINNLEIIQPDSISLTYSVTHLQCYGDLSGTITVNATGGSPAYQYSINGSPYMTNNTIIGLSAGFYNITVVDDSACTATLNNIEIIQPSELTATAQVTDVLCHNDSTGEITIIPNGGTAPYQYSLNIGGTYPFDGLTAGFYTVTVVDDSSCNYVINSIEIAQPTDLYISTDSIIDVLCNGDNTGAVAFTTTGGNPFTAPTTHYNYSFNNISFDAADSAKTGMTAGNYWVYVQDANACKDSMNFDIEEPTNPITLTQNSVNSTCSNSNGVAIIEATGGTPGYTYEWAYDHSTNDTLTGISAGGYMVSVTDSHNCIDSLTVNVSDAGAGILTFINDSNNVCFGDTLGTVEVQMTGGASPFTYTWSNGETSAIASNLAAGTYSVQVEDANNCIVSDSYTIVDSSQIQISLTNYNLNCYNDNSGIITAVVTGGSPTNGTDYTYTWSNGDSGVNIDSISGLGAAQYFVEVTDQYNCKMTDTITVTQPDSLIIDTLIAYDLSCFNNNTGSAAVDSVYGGTMPYTYTWSNGINGVNLDSISTLSAIEYTLTVTDNNGCTAYGTVQINEPTAIAVSDVINPTYCDQHLGSIDLTATGGTVTGDYSYTWNNLSDTIYSILDSNYIDTLAAGTYYVTVTDDNSCEYTNHYEIQNIPAGVISIVSTTNLNCYNDNSGQIIAEITGGTATYNFTWNNGTEIINQTNISNNIDSISNISAGTYTISVSDANNCVSTLNISIEQPADTLQATFKTIDNVCAGGSAGSIHAIPSGGTANYTFNWSNNTLNDSITNLVAGTYYLTTTDANGCQIVDTIKIMEQPAYSVTYTTTKETCNGDADASILLDVTGATEPYTYLWNNQQNTSNVTGITDGEYTVIVTDSYGCNYYDTIIVEPTPALQVDTTIYYENNLGHILLETTGGTPEYTYNWSDNSTSQDNYDLYKGMYSVTVTDANSCTAVLSFNIKEVNPILIPTVITPNADGKNDTWNIKYIESIEKIEIHIFNRWGDELFSFSGTGMEYTNTSNQWDGVYLGKELPLGTYVYIVKINEKDERSGTVTIVR